MNNLLTDLIDKSKNDSIHLYEEQLFKVIDSILKNSLYSFAINKICEISAADSVILLDELNKSENIIPKLIFWKYFSEIMISDIDAFVHFIQYDTTSLLSIYDDMLKESRGLFKAANLDMFYNNRSQIKSDGMIQAMRSEMSRLSNLCDIIANSKGYKWNKSNDILEYHDFYYSPTNISSMANYITNARTKDSLAVLKDYSNLIYRFFNEINIDLKEKILFEIIKDTEPLWNVKDKNIFNGKYIEKMKSHINWLRHNQDNEINQAFKDQYASKDNEEKLIFLIEILWYLLVLSSNPNKLD